ncbi:MAG: FRG domain-containing protein [Phycisphaerae bacterium]|nr:FRG domain-containing protein [Phycisphaerae bacterium]
MQIKNLKTWEEFEEELVELNIETERLREEGRGFVSPILFRGQSDSKWRLDSTLKRAVRGMVFSTYLERIRNIENTISTYTCSDWKISSKIGSYLKKADWNWLLLLSESDFLAIVEFMVYLRHHGFLSPLLDWSNSPYVAAFFAFDRQFEKLKDEQVAIFALREYCCGGKNFAMEKPHIVGIGSNLRTHKRHYLQQTEYTICGKRQKQEYIFCSNEDAELPTDEPAIPQDVVKKYIIPASEQKKVINKLKLMNITKYSLFGTEDALIQSLSMDMVLE